MLLQLLALLTFAQTSSIPAVKVNITAQQPDHHFYQIRITFPPGEQVDRIFKMPAWTPGSYKIRNFAKNVEGFRALDSDERELTWSKQDKSTWAVRVPQGREVILEYRLFAFEYTVRTNYLDRFFGSINPAAAIYYEPGQANQPFEIEVNLPQDWSTATALPRLGEGRYWADDYDTLIDSPLLFGPLRTHEFDVAGIPHYWVIAGDVKMNEKAMVDALAKVGRVVGDMFGSYPFDRYYYLTQFRIDELKRGGLEHHNSTLVQYYGTHMRQKHGWDNFLALMLHEYFHAWNVKAIQDENLRNPDLQQEVYTDLLWLHEGWTSYYDTMLMVRAGFWDEQDLFKDLAKRITDFRKTPGHGIESLREASFDAWIHFYEEIRTKKNSHNNYYRTGMLAALVLDLTIRHRTRNQAGLDTVVRALYERYAQKGSGISWDSTLEVIREIGGNTAARLVEQHVNQPQPLPLEAALAYAGVGLEVKHDHEKYADAPFQARLKPALGAEWKEKNGRLFVTQVRRGGAAWQAGLNFDDELIAINQRRLTEETIKRLMTMHDPGDEVVLTVSRGNHMVNLALKLEADRGKLILKRKTETTDLENQIFKALFQPPLPAAKAATAAQPDENTGKQQE